MRKFSQNDHSPLGFAAWLVQVIGLPLRSSKNPQYEEIFCPRNLDEDCDRIAGGINVVGETIKEILKVGMYKQAVAMYLQLLTFWSSESGTELAHALPSRDKMGLSQVHDQTLHRG